ncbi:MAG: M20 family peptidase, partial [Dehalococcoidales bacterium]|nr:M20 family peptidase [Dehalococcoidales bacterium]
HIKSTARIHGIITDGGKAANIVPAHSAGLFMVRAKENAYLDELKQKVLNCFTGAATATGARLEYQWDKVCYAPMRNNRPLAQLFARNMRSLGRRVTLSDTDGGFGSTDMGNVSQLVPAIHPQVAIAKRGVSIHSPRFAVSAASEDGIEGMLDAAKSLAMTVVDLVASAETMNQIKKEFQRQK